jgi:hypothetical protein
MRLRPTSGDRAHRAEAEEAVNAVVDLGVVDGEGEAVGGAELSAADQQLLRELTGRGPGRRVQADRRGGLPGALTKMEGSSAEANPLDSSVTPRPALRACCLAHSWPLTQIFIGHGHQVQTLTNAGPRPPRSLAQKFV